MSVHICVSLSHAAHELDRQVQARPVRQGRQVERAIPGGQLSGALLARGGSGYEQAETELRRLEGDEVAVALGPPA